MTQLERILTFTFVLPVLVGVMLLSGTRTAPAETTDTLGSFQSEQVVQRLQCNGGDFVTVTMISNPDTTRWKNAKVWVDVKRFGDLVDLLGEWEIVGTETKELTLRCIHETAVLQAK